MNKKPLAAGKSSFDLVDKDKVFSELGLKDGTVLLDVASGVGNYSLAAAEVVGKNGMIYAVDLWPEGIEELKSRAAASGLGNIRAFVADVSKKIPLADKSIDVCLIATALHDLVEERAGEGTLREVGRVLKNRGRLVIVEFKKTEGPPGPPKRIRLSPEELNDLVLPFGFEKGHIFDAGQYTYVSTFTLGPAGQTGGSTSS